MEVMGEPGGVLVIDDYGHHPSAIRATLEAVRGAYPGRPVWAVYEPLTFHRTAAMLDAFADVLSTADHAVIADIWAGRDPDRTIVSAADLAEAISARAPVPALATGSPRPPPIASSSWCGVAMSCWSWAAAARTSSRSGSSRAWRPASDPAHRPRWGRCSPRG
jgi:hypothetical protein